MDLLQIEVLGVSLPWTRIFTENVVGANYIKLLQENSRQSNTSQQASDVNVTTNPFLCNSNDISGSSSSNGGGRLAQQSTTDNLIDLLTGDLITSSQSEISSITENSQFNSQDPLDLFGGSVADNLFRAPDNTESESKNEPVKEFGGVQHYIDISTSLFGSNKVR